MVYHINNLREAVETVRHMLTKEKIDKQKTGQPSVSPFLKVSQQNPKKNKSVSFSMMETIQKQGDHIDKLTSLMNELSSKLDRTQPNISQECTEEEIEDVDKDRIDMALEIDLIVEKEVHIIVAETEGTIRMAIIMVIEVTNPEMGITKQIIGIMTGLSYRRENFN